MRRLRTGLASVIGMALVALLLWLLSPPPHVGAQAGITNFDSVVLAGDLLVGDDGTFGGNLNVTGVLAAADYITGAGDVTIPGALTVTDTLSVAGASTLTGI